MALIPNPAIDRDHILGTCRPDVLGRQAIVGDDDRDAGARKILTDVFPICLVAANEAPAGHEYHHRFRSRAALLRPVHIQPLAIIGSVGDVASDLHTIARLILEQGLVHRLREIHIEHGAVRANTPLACRKIRRIGGVRGGFLVKLLSHAHVRV